MPKNNNTIHTILILAPFVFVLGCSEERRITTRSAQALESYNVGVSQWEKFYYSEALRAFDEAIRLDSSFAMAWARRAILREATQNNTSARADISRALALVSTVTQYEQMFVRFQYYKLNYSNLRAAALADSMVLIYPEEKEVHLLRGNLYELDKNYENAIRSYMQAIDVDTSYALATMSLGYALSTIGEQEKAVEQMQRYIRLAPEAADPRASFADILLRVGRYDEALEQYHQSLNLKPDYWYSVNQIGLIYLLKGKLNAANEQFHKGIASLPEGPQQEANHIRADGTINLLRGKYREAQRQFEEALQRDSFSIEASFGLVNAHRKLHDFKRAHEVLKAIHGELDRRGLLQSQFMLSYTLTAAKLRVDQGDYELARSFCDRALEFTTALTRGPVFQQIAEIDAREKQYEDALDACEEALQVNPNNPDALLTLVKVYSAKGDTNMTNEIASRLLEFWKDADADYVNLLELQKVLRSRQPFPASGSFSPVMIASSLY